MTPNPTAPTHNPLFHGQIHHNLHKLPPGWPSPMIRLRIETQAGTPSCAECGTRVWV